MSEADLTGLVEMMPFAAGLGIELESATREEVRGRMRHDASLCTVAGVLHGGAVMSFADSLGGICAALNLPEGAGTTTVSSSTNMLRAVRSGTVTGTARPLHAGRTIIVVQTELRDDDGRLVAQTTQAQAVLSPR